MPARYSGPFPVRNLTISRTAEPFDYRVLKQACSHYRKGSARYARLLLLRRSNGPGGKERRAGTIDLDTGLAYATNPGNLRRQLADAKTEAPIESAIPSADASEPELVFELSQRAQD